MSDKSELKSELQPVELPDDVNVKALLRRSIFLSQDRLVGEHGARGFALCALVVTVCGLYWYEHHVPLVSSVLSHQSYHYALTKTFPLVQPKSQRDPAEGLATTTPPAPPAPHATVAQAEEAADTLLLQPQQLKPRTAVVTTHQPVLHHAVVAQAPKTRIVAPTYTLQLMGSFDQAQVLRKRQVWHIPQSHVFNQVYKQKTWYVLGVGAYKTQGQAQIALHRLPATLRGEGAWVRRIN